MSTYSPIASQTLASAASSVTFTGIPQNFTDLVLVVNAGASSASYDFAMRFNSDSGSNYSVTRLIGNGSTASSSRTSNNTFINTRAIPADITGNYIVQIQNYSNTTTYKTTLLRANNTASATEAVVGLYRSTSAITSITISPEFLVNFLSGSTFNLYGIASGSPKAFGGNTVTTDGTYWYHTFTSSGVFTPAAALTADMLVVAGGGGGWGGGGGAGGLLGFNSQSLSATNYTVTVGAGGNGTASNTNGSNSQFGALTASVGGGKGGPDAYAGGSGNGFSGGSGGGGGRNNGTGGSATSGQGYAGGTAGTYPGSTNGSGGGGGAGGVGGNTQSGPIGGDGGVGSSSYSAWGLATGTGQLVSSTYYYAGGGGGYSSGTRGAGGYGGGGQGSTNSGGTTNGTANTGGGGGAGAGGGQDGNGGSGIVIIRYAV